MSRPTANLRTRQAARAPYSGGVIAAGFRLFALLILAAAPAALADARLTLITNLAAFERTEGGWISPELTVARPFKELVVSWNAASNVSCRIDARTRSAIGWGRWWTFARWASTTNDGARTSVADQQDVSGRMDTDTLKLKSEASAVRLRVTFSEVGTTPAALSLIAMSTWSPDAGEPAETVAPVRLIEVPRKSQADYPEGVTQWCSPTSTAMLLAHWGGALKRPDLDLDVRSVAAGVFDPGWSGTGNWAFNTAYAGAKPGIRSCVARLGGMADLHALIDAGIPVAASVSYAMLKGAPQSHPGDGHLVVVCGFKPGVVVINDPGVRLERVRREFPAADFLRGWDASHRTAYLVWPATRPLPPSPLGTW